MILRPRNFLVLLVCLSVALGESPLELDTHRIDSLLANTTETYALKINQSHNDAEWNLFFVLEPADSSM